MKTDLLLRMDQAPIAPGKRAAAMPTSSQTGLPYSVNLSPQALTIPVSLETGKLHPGWLPDFAASSGYGVDSPSGQTIIAPWVLLVEPLAIGAAIIRVTANGLAVGDNVTLSHATVPNEQAVITGGPNAVGTAYEYTLSRPNTQQAFPSYSRCYNRGQGAGTGWISIVSGDQVDALQGTHINLWAYNANGTAERRLRLGFLGGLSSAEKAQFEGVTAAEWADYSLYATHAFLKGRIIAESGNLSGNLDVGGNLRVRSGVGEAGVVLGGSAETGYGINLLNREGRPVFAAVSPFAGSDVAVYFDDGYGQKDFYYHEVDGKGKLEIKVDTLIDGWLEANNILIGTGTYPGAFVGLHLGRETGLAGYGPDFVKDAAWDARFGGIQFGGQFGGGWEGWLDRHGINIDTTVKDVAADPLEHAMRWWEPTSLFSRYPNGKVVGAAVGAKPGEWFAWSRRDTRDVFADAGGDVSAQDEELAPAYFNAALRLRAGGLTELSGQAMQITASDYLAVKIGDGNASMFRADRVDLPGIDVANSLIYTEVTDAGSFVGIGTRLPEGARLISQADTMAQFRAQRSSGSFMALTMTYVAADDEGWISSSGPIVLAPNVGGSAPNSVLPPSATRKIDIGSLARQFDNVYARRGHFGALGSQSALTGSMYLTRSAPELASNLEAGNVVAYYEDGGLLPGAYIRYEDTDTHAVEVIAITSTGRPAVVEEQDAWEYDVFRAAEGTAQLWYAGTVGVHLGGNATDGYVRFVGLDDNNPAIGPAMVVFQRENTETAGAVDVRLAEGNLNGTYYYQDPIYGFAAGRKAASWVSMDEFNGYRFMFGTTQLARYKDDILLGDEVSAHLHIGPGDVTMYAGTTKTIELLGTGSANITGTLAVAAGGAITWAGGKGTADDTRLQYVEDANNFFYLNAAGGEFLSIATDDRELGVVIQLSGSMVGDDSVALGVGNTVNNAAAYAINASGFNGIFSFASGAGGAGIYGSANAASGVGIKAVASGSATTALQISGGIVDGGAQRYTAMGDATADTDALNRQTGDGRYAAIGSLASYLLATGATTGASSQAQAFTNGIIGPTWKPAADSTSALKIQDAAGTTDIVTVDTTNGRVGIGIVPGYKLAVSSVTTTSAFTNPVFVAASNDGANTIAGMNGLTFSVLNNHASGVITGASGVTGLVTSQYGAITTAKGLNASVSTLFGTIGTAYGLYATVAPAIGGITTGYGAYLSSTGASTNYGIYTAGGTAWFQAAAAAEKGLVVKLAASHSATAIEIQNSSGNVTAQFAALGGLIVNEQGADTDTRIEGDTEPNLFLLDASTDTLYTGGTTTRQAIDKNGDVWFEGAGAGLLFGSCYGNDIAWAQASAVQNTWYAVSDADMADGQLNLVTHDGSGKLTVTKAGKYLVSYALAAISSAANMLFETGIGITPSGGALSVANDGQTKAGGNASINRPMSATVIMSLAASDAIDICIRTTTAGAPTITVNNLNVSIVQIGA